MTYRREEEQREKWCPFGNILETKPMCDPAYSDTRLVPPVTDFVAAGVNRDSMDRPATKCYGEDCMAWRWYRSNRGYCGLAGPI